MIHPYIYLPAGLLISTAVGVELADGITRRLYCSLALAFYSPIWGISFELRPQRCGEGEQSMG